MSCIRGREGGARVGGRLIGTRHTTCSGISVQENNSAAISMPDIIVQDHLSRIITLQEHLCRITTLHAGISLQNKNSAVFWFMLTNLYARMFSGRGIIFVQDKNSAGISVQAAMGEQLGGNSCAQLELCRSICAR